MRFATVLSIPVVLFGSFLLIHALFRLYRDSRTLAALWTMIAAFSVGVALLTGYGRFEMFDASQAWVIRYGSFACLFWFAVLGAVLSLGNLESENRWIRYGYRTLVFMFAFNSLHFVPQVRDFSDDAKMLENAVIETWPDVAPEVLFQLYPTDPEVAVSGLQYLREKSWPPFDMKQ